MTTTTTRCERRGPRGWRGTLAPLAMLAALVFGFIVPATEVEARPGGGSSSSVSRGGSSSGGSRSSSSGSSSSSSRSGSSSGSSSSGGYSGGSRGLPPVIIIPGGGGGFGSGGSSAPQPTAVPGTSATTTTTSSGEDAFAGLMFILIVLAVIGFIIFSVVNAGRKARQALEGVRVDSLPAPTRMDEVERFDQDDNEIRAGTTQIKQRDPAFSEAQFTDRVETAYNILNQSWVRGDLSPALPFLGEGEANRLTMQLEGDRAAYRRNVMSNVVLSGTRIVRVEQSGHEDILVCRIDASAADWYEDVRTGKMVDGWQRPRPYTEYWTFARAQGAKTGRASYMSRTCPNCGAPLELGNISVCQYCGTPVHSTQYDWVLMNIDQKYTNDNNF